ncbi:MAG: phosphatase PAP2 family protein [Devosia sp.]|nr:phosphatase PAP2 family protein [Devosia sp.]
MFDLDRPWPLGLSRRNGLLLAAGFAVLIAALYWLDRPLSQFGTGLPESVRAVFAWLTQWGESDWILVPALVLLLLFALLRWIPYQPWRGAFGQLAATSGFVFLGVGLPGLASTLLKRLIGRGRPEVYQPDLPLVFRWNFSEYDYQSFPSGHATTSFAMAMVVAFLWPRLTVPALVFALVISLSRIVVGAHYVTDITAGAVLGTLGAYAVRNAFAARNWLFSAAGGRIVRQPFTPVLALFRR